MRFEIWKYPFTTADTFCLSIPKGGKILSLDIQYGPTIWALVDTEQPGEQRTFVTYGTGCPIISPESKTYIGTYQEMGGALVWHVFELLERKNNE